MLQRFKNIKIKKKILPNCVAKFNSTLMKDMYPIETYIKYIKYIKTKLLKEDLLVKII